MWHLLFLLLMLTADAAHGETSTRPFWTEQAMFRFGEDLFFVGVASCMPSAEAGRDAAFRQGLKELLHYSQRPSAEGLTIETQMTFEERAAAGCATNTVSVWRLLRLPAAAVIKSPARRPAMPTPEQGRAPSIPHDLTPFIGMSRQAVWERFGQPRAITARDAEAVWEYASGLTVIFDRTGRLLRWAWPTTSSSRPEAGRLEDPPIDLTARLKELEAARPRHEPLADQLALRLQWIARGRALYRGKGACVACHGLSGRGMGVYAAQLHPRPTDLTDRAAQRLRSNIERFQAIKHGIPGTAMVPMMHLTDDEIWLLVDYLNVLRGDPIVGPQP